MLVLDNYAPADLHNYLHHVSSAYNESRIQAELMIFPQNLLDVNICLTNRLLEARLRIMQQYYDDDDTFNNLNFDNNNDSPANDRLPNHDS